MRIGFGYDVHRFTSGRKLILGGVEIDYEKGLDGHSDADVLLHAITDGLLGAAALGDIGVHFPPGDPEYKGISSLTLLERAYNKVTKAGYRVGNIDATIVCERPRLAAHVPSMIENISTALGIDTGRVSVKATTTEGLGFAGSGEGIAAYAVTLIEGG
ncbi:MAG: 2-C-methyl-D-erythritol 2,4-cyclodiphosphate synthase [bacterium]|nr:2-C-methyl-D-erythritol 2,4-cyclodiphosphate synthase [bacterium]